MLRLELCIVYDNSILEARSKIIPKTVHGHSIWLIPAEPEFGYFQDLITNLSMLSDTPRFRPHVTLLGQLPHEVNWIKGVLVEYVQTLKPMSLSFSHVGLFDLYFRSIILHAELTNDLKRWYAEALIHFEVSTADAFLPHLSLLYSMLSPQDKQQLLRGTAMDYPSSICVEEILLMKTEGAPDQWREVMKLSL